MKWFFTFINSSIMKKQLMALTGLLLSGFLVSHFAGNTLIILNPRAFNFYAHNLTSNPLIYIAEAGLLALFLSHMFMAFKLTLENKQARGKEYFVKTKTGRGATFASSTMIVTGLIILVFLVLHILHFKFGTMYTVNYDGQNIRDLHRTVLEYFQSPLHVLWYIVAMSAVAIHVSHGFASAFQSLGFNHPKYNCSLKCFSKLFAFGIAIGFASIAVWSYCQGGQA